MYVNQLDKEAKQVEDHLTKECERENMYKIEFDEVDEALYQEECENMEIVNMVEAYVKDMEEEDVKRKMDRDEKDLQTPVYLVERDIGLTKTDILYEIYKVKERVKLVDKLFNKIVELFTQIGPMIPKGCGERYMWVCVCIITQIYNENSFTLSDIPGLNDCDHIYLYKDVGDMIHYNIGNYLYQADLRYDQIRSSEFIKHLSSGTFGKVDAVVITTVAGITHLVAEKKYEFCHEYGYQQFYRELEILRKLSDVDCIPDIMYATIGVVGMSIGPKTLRNVIYEKKQCMTYDHIINFMIDIMNVLSIAHERGVTHRDLKPDNIIVKSCGKAMVIDWGSGTVDGTDSSSWNCHVTTRWYRPPEIASRDPSNPFAGDVWSAGCIFVEMLQRKPFYTMKRFYNKKAWESNHPSKMEHLSKWVQRGVFLVISDMLQLNKSQRLSAKECLEELQKLRK